MRRLQVTDCLIPKACSALQASCNRIEAMYMSLAVVAGVGFEPTTFGL
jgi:hypothetical protein